MANAYYRKVIPWYGLPPETHTGTGFWTHSEARTHLRAIYALDSSLAMKVAEFSWVQGYIGWDKVRALESLAQLIDISPETAGLVIGFPWLSDELTDAELRELQELADLANENPAAVQGLL